MAYSMSKRWGSFQPFVQLTERDDGTSIGCQYGVITYDKDDNYRISYVEVGFRCDHLHDFVGQEKSERSFDDAPAYDADIVTRRSDYKAAVADLEANPAPNAD